MLDAPSASANSNAATYSSDAARAYSSNPNAIRGGSSDAVISSSGRSSLTPFPTPGSRSRSPLLGMITTGGVAAPTSHLHRHSVPSDPAQEAAYAASVRKAAETGEQEQEGGTQQWSRSYDLPKRNDEKEIERKLKSRRLRESRRSTQGVTKEDLDRAEVSLREAGHGQGINNDRSEKENQPEAAKPLSDQQRSSLRTAENRSTARVDGNSIKSDQLPVTTPQKSARTSDSDVRTASPVVTIRESGLLRGADSTSAVGRSDLSRSLRPSSLVPSSSETTAAQRPVTSSVTSLASNARPPSGMTTTVDPPSTVVAPTHSHSRFQLPAEQKSNGEEKDEKDDPSNKSSAIRSKRKRESRRPTGKVEADDLTQAVTLNDDKAEKANDENDAPFSVRNSSHSSSESVTPSSVSRSGSAVTHRSRPEVTLGLSRSDSRPTSYSAGGVNVDSLNRDIDYKKLYEEEKTKNEKLKRDVDKTRDELKESKQDVEKLQQQAKENNSSLGESSSSKIEKRAIQRRISELEEELKEMELVKADNQRLKKENEALIRVISKLSK